MGHQTESPFLAETDTGWPTNSQDKPKQRTRFELCKAFARQIAIPASDVPAIIQRPETTTAADRTVSEFAAADMAANFSPA